MIERGARGVRGNHEEWFLDWLGGGNLEPIVFALHIGGRETLVSYGVLGARAADAMDAGSLAALAMITSLSPYGL